MGMFWCGVIHFIENGRGYSVDSYIVVLKVFLYNKHWRQGLPDKNEGIINCQSSER